MYIMVLNETQTFSSLDGCRIMYAPDELDATEIGAQLAQGEEEGELITIRRFGPTPIDEEIGLGRPATAETD